MTRSTTATVAGVTYWIYFAAGIGSMLLAGNAPAVGVVSMVMSFSALVLGVTLYAITREVQAELALFALLCRVIEAVPGHGEIYFAVGSAVFCWLLLRGRMIPVPLARLGLVASVLIATLLPLQVAGYFGGPRAWSSPVTWAIWLPMLVFELTFAVWLIAKGVTTSESSPESRAS